ncbi:MAG TPA: glutamine--fructose-6-phosphate transaminase (isomerizing) [Caldisericia bacterium]|nr:glutamine--fructose-6-phosphate transaminase (isomerizing) [Caldisericia bacterium]HXK51483.1 glutamine--fructose-6-phosphate transaminase (isomerizing) [Caldisericia bacterium]
MCGVFGIIFPNDTNELGDILIKGSRKLVYRGYDSAGFAAFQDNGATVLKKGPGMLESIIQKEKISEYYGNRGIVQLRWATFGEPNAENSQPHYDSDKDIIGAHNGNIVNTEQLIEQFTQEGMVVRGTNDGEMVVHAYEKFFNQLQDPKQAMMKAQTILQGDYAFICGNIDRHQLLAVKMGSSLYMGVGKDFIVCSSDLGSILQFTRNIVYLKDGDLVLYDHNSYHIYDIHTGKEIQRPIEQCDIRIEEANLLGFDHYMMKEIHEQPKKVQELYDLLENTQSNTDDMIELINQSDHVYLVASGTSYHAAVVGAYYLNHLAGIHAVPVLAGYFNEYYNVSPTAKDVIFCVSQSGETKDVINVINPILHNTSAKIISMVNVIGSSIAQKSEIVMNVAAGLETSVPATKSYMNQLFAFLYLATYAGKKKGYDKAKEIDRYLPQIPKLLEATLEETKEDAKEIADLLVKRGSDLYCLGYGIQYGTALEGALKIKEVYYKHCEGMYSSEFKHGPLSIVDEGYPILFPASPADDHMVISHINEIRVRKGNVIVISPQYHGYAKAASRLIAVPDSDHYFIPLTTVVVLQLIAYYASVQAGLNPDFPRNISKTLTVD